MKTDPDATAEEKIQRLDQAISEAIAWREGMLEKHPDYFTNLPVPKKHGSPAAGAEQVHPGSGLLASFKLRLTRAFRTT
jgi:hypothetical protein